MKYGSSRDASDRSGGSLSRVTLVKADDAHFMQECTIQGFAGEAQEGIEHFHPYGFTAVPVSAQLTDKQCAEGIAAFLGGNRSHGVVLVMGDRRHRVMGMKEGEVCFHDNSGQQIHLSRDGTFISAPNGGAITGQIMSGSGAPPATQPAGATATMGQGVQAGGANVVSFKATRDGFTAQFGTGSNAVIVKVDKDHSVLKHKKSGNTFWVDEHGVFTTTAITVAADPYGD